MVKKEKNKSFILIFVLLMISLLLLMFSIIYNPDKVSKKEEIFAKLMIGEPAGFDVNDSALIFGRLPPSTSANRQMIITNNYGFPIYAEFSIKGNISDFIIPNPPVYLNVGEKENVVVSTIEIPKDAVFGIYEGIFVINFKKAVGSQ